MSDRVRISCALPTFSCPASSLVERRSYKPRARGSIPRLGTTTSSSSMATIVQWQGPRDVAPEMRVRFSLVAPTFSGGGGALSVESSTVQRGFESRPPGQFRGRREAWLFSPASEAGKRWFKSSRPHHSHRGIVSAASTTALGAISLGSSPSAPTISSRTCREIVQRSGLLILNQATWVQVPVSLPTFCTGACPTVGQPDC